MICQKCKREVPGRWCSHCGAAVETQNFFDTKNAAGEAFNSEIFNNHDTAPITPVSYGSVNSEEKYRDDVFDPNAEDGSEYYNKDLNPGPYSYDDDPRDSKAKIIAIISVCAVLAVVMVFVLVKAVFFKDSGSDGDEAPQKPVQGEQEDVKALFKTAEKYMTIGDYEAAEEAYLELTEITDDEEALLLYNIVYNYNRALKKFEASNFEDAKKHFDKIPVEYVDYEISDDVDDLGNDIDLGIGAYETFENIKGFMKDEDYDAAREEIEILDKKYLSKEDKEYLDEIKDELNKIEQEAKYDLTSHEAESFIMEYCDAMVDAINNNDFSLVSSYIDSKSELYETQRGLVAYCASEGITESFDSLRLKKFTKLNSKTWEAAVSETETIYYDDGTEETKTYSWTYTIKYIDSEYYVSGIR